VEEIVKRLPGQEGCFMTKFDEESFRVAWMASNNPTVVPKILMPHFWT
jgi:hypothetical protein